MQYNKEQTEKLMNLYLDGCLNESQYKQLESLIVAEPEAGETFEQLKMLEKYSAEAVNDTINRSSQRDFDDIFESAWQIASTQGRGTLVKRIIRYSLAAAASLLLIFTIATTLDSKDPAAVNSVETVAASAGTLQRQASFNNKSSESKNKKSNIQNVDFYHFTDTTGGSWIMEGYRKDLIKYVDYKPVL